MDLEFENPRHGDEGVEDIRLEFVKNYKAVHQREERQHVAKLIKIEPLRNVMNETPLVPPSFRMTIPENTP